MSWVVLDRFCLIVVIIKTGEYSWMDLTIHGNMVCCVVHQFDLCYTIILKLFLLNTFRVLYDRIYRVSRQYFPLSHVSPKLFCIWLTTSFSPPAMHMHLLNDTQTPLLRYAYLDEIYFQTDLVKWGFYTLGKCLKISERRLEARNFHVSTLKKPQICTGKIN